mgnify:FL=1
MRAHSTLGVTFHPLMFTILESKTDISRAQAKLEATIHRALRRQETRNIGYPGGTTENATVYTDGTIWYWAENHANPNPRRLNWFGLYASERDLEISVEINTPFIGVNGHIAGFFARDSDTKRTYLFHTGRVGGGTKGVHRRAFMAWSDRQPIEALDSAGERTSGLIVMPVEGSGAIQPAIGYIKSIAAFKQAVRGGLTETKEFKQKIREFDDFYSEPRGKRTGTRSSVIDYVSRHGDVVDALHAWLTDRGTPSGTRLVKSPLIDLGLARRKELLAVYEVKTGTTRSDLYGAIGQLMVHGARPTCRRYLVVPNSQPLPDDITEAVQIHEIGVLRYEIDETGVRIK